MRKLARFVPWLLGLLMAAAIVFPNIAREAAHRRASKLWPAFQSRVLDRAFSSVQFKDGGVLLTPARQRTYMVPRMRTMDGLFFEGPQQIVPGAQFKVIEHHWGATYTVRGIQRDGVLVDYVGGDQNSGSVRGQVLLAWK